MNRREPPPTSPPPAHFSVHAEFTISHPGADDPRNKPRTSMERDEATGGVRMVYTWQPDWSSGRAQSEEQDTGSKQEGWPTSKSNSNKSIFSDTPSSATLTPPRSIPPRITPPSAMFNTDYTRGYQKGNMFFTSTPPPKGTDDLDSSNIPKDPNITNRGLIHDSSGYGSDLMSPNSQRSSLPRVFDRKCRSTCNITLSTNLTGSGNVHSQRTQSLRCQTPSNSPKNPIRYYGCGDPWCHHLKPVEEISPVPEETSSAHETLIIKDSGKRDACVQTFEMVDKCTSPFMRMNSNESISEGRNWRRYQKRGMTEPISRLRNYSSGGGGSYTPDSLESSVKSTKRSFRAGSKLRRTPAFDHSVQKEASPDDSKAGDSLKKPRTVHIDVYCTGTEMESNASSDSSDEDTKSASTPQTVFENEKLRVTHKKADHSDMPFYLRKLMGQRKQQDPSSNKSFETNTSVEKEESDDECSTAYPSKMSSYSNIGDISRSVSSIARSWTTYSMSSCAIPEDYDSVANTSWKDTFSDIDSLLLSRSSIVPTDSLDFVPRRRYETTQSIDETPEYSYNDRNLLGTPSVDSIQPSDSFEYANSEDRARIKRMEEMLMKNKGNISSEMQQRRMKDYLEEKMKQESKDSETDSDGSGKGWTIVKKNTPTKVEESKSLQKQLSPSKDPLPNTVRNALLRSGISIKSEPPAQNPSEIPEDPEIEPVPQTATLRLNLDPNLRSPFMVVPGIYTEPRSIANKFGTVVNIMKKPGHHVGPAKNPDCLCDHCQSYWQAMGRNRNRTRSMGDPPSGQFIQNWKEFLADQQRKSQSSGVTFTDF